MKIMNIRNYAIDETEIYRVTDEEAKVIEKFINLPLIESALDEVSIKVSIECSINIKDF